MWLSLFLCNETGLSWYFYSETPDLGSITVQMAESHAGPPDGEIVNQVLKGDKEAYAVLVVRWQHLLYRLAVRMLGDTHMAEEAVQRAFITGYEKLERLNRPEAFGSWVAGITRNLCRNVLRDRTKQPVSLDSLAEAGTLPTNPGDPGSATTELIAAVRRLIPRLSEKDREILELRYTQGYSCRKVAEVLDLSPSAAASRLHQARKRLLRMLNREGWK